LSSVLLVETLENGYRIFEATIPANIFTWIKFADPTGSPKTNNIPLEGFETGTCFYFESGVHESFMYGIDPLPEIEVTHVTYYFATDTDASAYYAYVWEDGGHELADWPGTEMSYIETSSNGYDIYGFDVLEGEYDHIIFSGTDSQPKTPNIPLSGVLADTVFYIDGILYGTYIFGTQDGPDLGGDEDRPDLDIEGTIIYYFETDTTYDTYYAYAWKDSGSKNATYPGEAMTFVETLENGHDLYMIRLDATRGWQYIKFSANDNELKSPTIELAEIAHRTIFLLDGTSYLYGDSPEEPEERPDLCKSRDVSHLIDSHFLQYKHACQQ